jgi:hypothetical protein
VLHAVKMLDKSAVVALKLESGALFRGGFVGLAELKGCRPFTRTDANFLKRNRAFVGPWKAGYFAWELTNVRRLSRPVSFRGGLGLFSVSIPLGKREM